MRPVVVVWFQNYQCAGVPISSHSNRFEKGRIFLKNFCLWELLRRLSGTWPEESSIFLDNLNVANKHQHYCLLQVTSLSIFISYLNFIIYTICQSPMPVHFIYIYSRNTKLFVLKSIPNLWQKPGLFSRGVSRRQIWDKCIKPVMSILILWLTNVPRRPLRANCVSEIRWPHFGFREQIENAYKFYLLSCRFHLKELLETVFWSIWFGLNRHFLKIVPSEFWNRNVKF